MAMKLSETFRLLEQQEKRAAAEKNELGHGLFLKSSELLKQANDLTEEAGIKLAASTYQENAPAAPTEKAEGQNQTKSVVQEEISSSANATALDMIKFGLQKVD